MWYVGIEYRNISCAIVLIFITFAKNFILEVHQY